MDKARSEKDFVTIARDNACEQIHQANKMLSEMSKATLNIRKSNGLLKQEIGGVRFLICQYSALSFEGKTFLYV